MLREGRTPPNHTLRPGPGEKRKPARQSSLALLGLAGWFLLASPAFSQPLEIHYINVGQGSAVLVKGPDGTTILLEAGGSGKGTNEVVPYLQSIGIQPADGLDYTIVGHQDCDHLGGMDEVVGAGYDVRVLNYFNGSEGEDTKTCVSEWTLSANSTTAGPRVAMPVGTVIPLGAGAKLTAVAVDGSILGGGSVSVSNENDRSIAVLIQYGGFDYLWASDLGGGDIDEACTGRSTSQRDVESAVIAAISPQGAFPQISAGGIDVLHVNHHGSESSTNKNWMNGSQPAVAVISVGAGQGSNFQHPRVAVVENVLLANATDCITALPAFVLQTEEGAPTGPETSFAGLNVGNVKITTDGQSLFLVSADGDVTQGPNEVPAAALPRAFVLDDAGAGQIPPGPFLTLIPHSASGAGFLSRLFIGNLVNRANALVVNRLDQSGALVETTSTSLQPAGALLLPDSEERRTEELTLEWFAIGSEQPIAASILFDFDSQSLGLSENFQTAVGALGSKPLTAFTLPVRVATVEVTVGLALANLSGSANTVNLKLFDNQGAVLAQDSITLEAFAQTAFSLHEREAFRDLVLGVPEFVGALAVTTADPAQPIAALVIGNNLRQLYSLPVSLGAAE